MDDELQDELQALRSERGCLKARIHELGREKQLLLNEVKRLRELVGEEPGVFKININGKDEWVGRKEITYENLANMAGYNPEWTPSIMYKGSGDTGMLTRNQSITLEEGMRFTIVITGAA